MGEVSEVLYNIWNLIKDMTWQISIVILIVISCRVFVQKISKQACYFLWLIVAVRLLVPVMIPSSFSVFNWMEKPQLEQMYEKESVEAVVDTPDINIKENQTSSNDPAKQESLDNVYISKIHQIEPDASLQDSSHKQKTDKNTLNENSAVIKVITQNWDFILWIAGMNLMLIYGIVSYVLLKNKLRFATKNPNGFMECDKISSPFVFGVLKPVIYLPYHLSVQEQKFILSHERYHIRRRDYLVKLFAFALLAVYWFHPLVWVAFYLTSRDMEASCDEQVLKDFGIEDRKAYSSLLLSFASNKRYPLPSPLSFGENDVKSRIKKILNYKKPTFWGIVAVVVITILVAVCCLTDAKSKDLEPETEMTEDEVLAFLEKLYDAKNPYIGDVYADRTIMSLLLEELGVTGFSGNEIQTYEEPYWISFSFDEEPNDNRMWQASAMFMTLVDNAEEVRWTFYDEYDSLKTYYVTVDSVNQYLEGKSLKDYAVSYEKLAELWNMLDEKRTYAAIASGEYKSFLVATSNWERQVKKAGLDFTERITWENRLREDGIGYRDTEGYVAGCQYQDFDQNGMMDFAITIIDHQREDGVVSSLYIYMNDDPAYIYDFAMQPLFCGLQTADIDEDGYLEFIFSGDSGGTGGYGFNAYYAILKYKNKTFEEMPLPTDEYLEWTDDNHPGVGLEVYATEQKNKYEIYCPLIKESCFLEYESADDLFQSYPKAGTKVGNEFYGFYGLTPVNIDGKIYLSALEELCIEPTNSAHGYDTIGSVSFLLSWNHSSNQWEIESFDVISNQVAWYFDDILFSYENNWETMSQKPVYDDDWHLSDANKNLKGSYENQTLTLSIENEVYSIDLSNELEASKTYEWEIMGIYHSYNKYDDIYIFLNDFDVNADGSSTREPGLLMVTFSPNNPDNYQITSYQGSFEWYDNCYMIGDNFYIQDENGLRTINVITKDLYECKEEYALLKDYAANSFHESNLCYLFNASQEIYDVTIYSAMVSEAEDIPPVGMVFMAYKDGKPFAFLRVDFSADNALNGIRVEMAN